MLPWYHSLLFLHLSVGLAVPLSRKSHVPLIWFDCSFSSAALGGQELGVRLRLVISLATGEWADTLRAHIVSQGPHRQTRATNIHRLIIFVVEMILVLLLIEQSGLKLPCCCRTLRDSVMLFALASVL